MVHAQVQKVIFLKSTFKELIDHLGECQKWEEIITMQYQQIKYDKYNSRNALTAGGWKNLGLWGHHKCK